MNTKQVSNYSFIQNLAQDLIKSKSSNYSQDCVCTPFIIVAFYLQENRFIVEDIRGIDNMYGERLKCSLIRHRQHPNDDEIIKPTHQNQQQPQQTEQQRCIVYLHGLGSNRLEGFSILPHMPKNYKLMTFDLSGSGKSQGNYVTYGYRQKDDIDAVLRYLYEKKGLRNFVIWGRSMGAVSTLLFAKDLDQREKSISTVQKVKSSAKKQSKGSKHSSATVSSAMIHKSIKCIVADSPFSSFQEIAKEIAQKRMSIPQFLSQIALSILNKVFSQILYDKKQKKSFNPFQINFNNGQKESVKISIPMIFVYSLNDQVVNSNHSEKIISKIQDSNRLVEKIVIPECGHNYRRPVQVFQGVFQKIEKNIKNQVAAQYSNSKHLNSKSSNKQQSCRHNRMESFSSKNQQQQQQSSQSTIITSTPRRLQFQNEPNNEIGRQQRRNSLISPNLNSNLNGVTQSQQLAPAQSKMFTRQSSQQSMQNGNRKRGISLSSKQKRIILGNNGNNSTKNSTSILHSQNNKQNFSKKRRFTRKNYSMQLKDYDKNHNDEQEEARLSARRNTTTYIVSNSCDRFNPFSNNEQGNITSQAISYQNKRLSLGQKEYKRKNSSKKIHYLHNQSFQLDQTFNSIRKKQTPTHNMSCNIDTNYLQSSFDNLHQPEHDQLNLNIPQRDKKIHIPTMSTISYSSGNKNQNVRNQRINRIINRNNHNRNSDSNIKQKQQQREYIPIAGPLCCFNYDFNIPKNYNMINVIGGGQLSSPTSQSHHKSQQQQIDSYKTMDAVIEDNETRGFINKKLDFNFNKSQGRGQTNGQIMSQNRVQSNNQQQHPNQHHFQPQAHTYPHSHQNRFCCSNPSGSRLRDQRDVRRKGNNIDRLVEHMKITNDKYLY